MRKNENRILNQDLVIPEETQRKIEAAYDIVRARNRAAQDGRKKIPCPRRVWKPSAAVVLAATMILICGLGVAAAVGHFTKQVEETDSTASYTFEVNYELKPVEVTAVPEYLPEDMTVADGGKYGSGKEDGRNITVWAMNMADIDYYCRTMDFTGVEKVEKTTIQGMEAHLITYQDAGKYRKSKDIYLFNPEDGYVLWVWGDYAVSMDELAKVAEGLTITVTENPELAYMTEEEKTEEARLEKEAQEAWEAAVDRGVAPEDITAVGETLDALYLTGASYTVEEAAFYDSLYEVPGYNPEGVCNREELEAWLNEDGTHKPYLRSTLDENAQIVEEKEMGVKFLAVTATVRQEKAYDPEWDNGTPFDAVLVRLEENEDGRLVPAPERYAAVPSEDYDLQMEGRCFYLNQTADTMNDPQYFWRHMEAGDSQTYTMVFAVDEDLAENQEENQNLVLIFNGTGNDPENPRYSALW
ncbi:MAG TPA: DUF4367 domain-containing protein [Candidatus Merdisoma faecalis]|nr:DUF4367 domain-containing protein [Candidatus Merdisoma faecalis]